MIHVDVLRHDEGWPDVEPLVEPTVAAVLREANATLPAECEMSLVLADDAQVRELNGRWRGKDRATNVLSFPSGALEQGMAGDVVMARETMVREAAEQNKSFEDHFRHLLAHGLLHLLGFDHETDDEAQTMEDAEKGALARLGLADPYE